MGAEQEWPCVGWLVVEAGGWKHGVHYFPYLYKCLKFTIKKKCMIKKTRKNMILTVFGKQSYERFSPPSTHFLYYFYNGKHKLFKKILCIFSK